MDDYITKPVKPEELQGALERSAPAAEAAPAPAAATEDTVDLTVIAALRDLQDPDEPDFVTELIDLLLGEFPKKVGAIEEALAGGNAHGVNRTAHSLKSSCGNLGAMPLQKIIFAIERKGAEGDLAGVPSLIADANAEFARVKVALAAQRQGAEHEAA